MCNKFTAECNTWRSNRNLVLRQEMKRFWLIKSLLLKSTLISNKLFHSSSNRVVLDLSDELSWFHIIQKKQKSFKLSSRQNHIRISRVCNFLMTYLSGLSVDWFQKLFVPAILYIELKFNYDFFFFYQSFFAWLFNQNVIETKMRL